MHELGSFCSEDRGAEDASGGGIGDYLYEALVLPYFARLALLPPHVEGHDLDLVPGLPGLALGHPDAPQLGVGEDGVRHDPVRGAGSITRHLRQENPVIVPRSVRKHRAAPDVPRGPDPFDGRRQTFIDLDYPPGGLEPYVLEPEVVGVRQTTRRHEEVRDLQLGGVPAVERQGEAVLVPGNALGAFAEHELDTFVRQDSVEGLGDVVVLAGGHVVGASDDHRDAATQAVVELGHLQPYVAAPDHREALRKFRLRQPVPRLDVIDLVQTFYGREKCARARIEDDLPGEHGL